LATRVEAPRERLYEDDFYAWTRQQAALLRARRFAALDLEHLIDAILEAGDMQREAALSNAHIVLEHLLKLAHSPAQGARNGWRATVREHRARLELGLTPQLRQALEDELPRVYAIARRNAEGALRDHGEPADRLPLRARPDHRRLLAAGLVASETNLVPHLQNPRALPHVPERSIVAAQESCIWEMSGEIRPEITQMALERRTSKGGARILRPQSGAAR